ncbi:hypothetical protein BD410DRAFT_868674 [Rickenella mellea]|uniref:Uncharacterized protein n=1 Tax=Rickenella mellea TaxID=50990 RepID=A0A4Y7PF23_9AGAM|nr:hypothetical protein BD410DRAFT_868674 [Rickenella mellea]
MPMDRKFNGAGWGSIDNRVTWYRGRTPRNASNGDLVGGQRYFTRWQVQGTGIKAGRYVRVAQIPQRLAGRNGKWTSYRLWPTSRILDMRMAYDDGGGSIVRIIDRETFVSKLRGEEMSVDREDRAGTRGAGGKQCIERISSLSFGRGFSNDGALRAIKRKMSRDISWLACAHYNNVLVK